MNVINPDSSESNGRAPVSLAAGNGHFEAVEVQLKVPRADRNLLDSEGITPMCWAEVKRHERIKRLLRDAGAEDNTNAKFSTNVTFFLYYMQAVLVGQSFSV